MKDKPYFFDQRARAAFLAISRRLLAESFLALARPPFLAPLRPKSTAAGSLPSPRRLAPWLASSRTCCAL